MIQNNNKIDSPLGEDSTGLYAAQNVYVGFHSSPGEGACAVMTGYLENKPTDYTDLHKFKKNKKNLNNLCNLWAYFFHMPPGEARRGTTTYYLLLTTCSDSSGWKSEGSRLNFFLKHLVK